MFICPLYTSYKYKTLHKSKTPHKQLQIFKNRNRLIKEGLRLSSSVVSGKRKRALYNKKFRKFKVALNPIYRIFLSFTKSCVLSCLSHVDNIKNFTLPFLNYKPLKLYLRVFLASYTVAMVTYCVKKMITTCSPIVG